MLRSPFHIRRLFSAVSKPIPYFKIVEEANLSVKDPQLYVSKTYGFLPRQEPLFKLPAEFKKMEEIIARARITQPDGSKGLLGQGKFGEVVEKELPMVDVSKIEDSRLLEALMRDYSYLASMYLLEPCDLQYKKSGDYGKGRERLPANIAVPLCKLAEKLNVKPFLEYTNYILYNWVKKDPTKGFHPTNLIIPRMFEGGKDEHWFMSIHLFMLEHSGKLVEHTLEALRACEKKDRKAFDQALRSQLANSKKINKNMDVMWEGSEPKNYTMYRTFIMGVKNQPMFPNGVVYEGVSSEKRFYRGETGANDSMIPTLDNLFEVTANMPENPLTSALKEFRSYRPMNHQKFVGFIEEKARELGVKKFALADPNSTVLYLANLDQIAEFRERHWRFTKEYIIKHTKHPVATGGTPITTWLPNQLGVVLKVIEEVGSSLDQSKLSSDNKTLLKDVLNRATTMRKILTREVEELKKKFPNQDG